jgi:integrase/recombinase XerD
MFFINSILIFVHFLPNQIGKAKFIFLIGYRLYFFIYILFLNTICFLIFKQPIKRYKMYITKFNLQRRLIIMNNLQTRIEEYLKYCEIQKRLDAKTLKAYKIDLSQFIKEINTENFIDITPSMLENFIANLHRKYKPKTVKRKIASIKALFHYFEYRDLIEKNPFNKLQIKFREAITLPKIIPLNYIEAILSTIYDYKGSAKTKFQQKNALRDVAVIELLFATGMRISELCSLGINDINLDNGTILIFGKGSKERMLQIGNVEVINILKEYHADFLHECENCGNFFANQSGNPLSDQTVRRMINKYTELASINLHITPHMFRHTFATSLLDADVDIRYIQEMLGHSSINITEIYTHVATAKQKNILSNKHPRNMFHI